MAARVPGRIGWGLASVSVPGQTGGHRGAVAEVPVCGRFALSATPEALARFIGLIRLFTYDARYNIAPTQRVVVVRYTSEGPAASRMRWGLIPGWARGLGGSPLINARVETVLDKPAFKDAIRRRRCLIPATGFYEWRQEGAERRPFFFQDRDHQPLLLAAVWERWTAPTADLFGDRRVVESCAILTTRAHPPVSAVHPRMPLIIPRGQIHRWLRPDLTQAALRPLLAPSTASPLVVHRVGPHVDSVKVDSPACALPTGAPPTADSLPAPARKPG